MTVVRFPNPNDLPNNRPNDLRNNLPDVPADVPVDVSPADLLRRRARRRSIDQQFSAGVSAHGPSLRISCSDCCMADTNACADCVVTLLTDGPARTRAVQLNVDEATTVDLFRRVGLVPAVRHRAAENRAVSW
jgi:hypothetical protein